MSQANSVLQLRLDALTEHLQLENPILVEAAKEFRELDRVAYKLGLLETDESFATKISWWPLITVLGTYSAGKSTFINDFLGKKLQDTGNQAVDDKFTVICFSQDDQVHELPGRALDSDPRFPFYQIADEIEHVAPGEGMRVDTYTQMKTCRAEHLRGKIIIDSPGFDADEQRDSTLRITDYIMDLSDLVLVLFDARRPEPGAMQDTLKHLVANVYHRGDFGKFQFVLNQIDTTAREDNAEDVLAAWHRALAKHGLSAGRFYAVYSDTAAVPIEDASLRERFRSKRDHDMELIYSRIADVGVQRVYRIVGTLSHIGEQIEFAVVPRLQQALRRWRQLTLTGDGLTVLAILLVFGGVAINYGWGLGEIAGFVQGLGSQPNLAIGLGVALVVVLAGIHFLFRNLMADKVAATLQDDKLPGNLVAAFRKNTEFWRPMWRRNPWGWSKRSRLILKSVRDTADRYVQRLNDQFTNPSGTSHPSTLAGAQTESEE